MRSSKNPIPIVSKSSSPIASRPKATTREKNQSKIETKAITPTDKTPKTSARLSTKFTFFFFKQKTAYEMQIGIRTTAKPTTCPTAKGTPGMKYTAYATKDKKVPMTTNPRRWRLLGVAVARFFARIKPAKTKAASGITVLATMSQAGSDPVVVKTRHSTT